MSTNGKDAQTRIKEFLDFYIDNENLLLDDGETEMNILIAKDLPNYLLTYVFDLRNIDLIFSVGGENSKAIMDGNSGLTIGYNERVPVTMYTVDKIGLTATKALQQAKKELRAELEAYGADAGYRALSNQQPVNLRVGAAILWACEATIACERGII